jgi:SAM-dependent methyltransferase
VPQLTRILSKHRPSTILDVGAGTGHIARSVNEALPYDPEWTLLDIDGYRLALAGRLKPAGMSQRILECDIFEMPSNEKFQGAIVTFTFLEIPNLADALAIIGESLDDGAILAVAMPDGWRDVWDQARERPELFEEFLLGSSNLQKVDKFTGAPYPFRATRVEKVIEFAFGAGFELFDMISNNDSISPVYVLVFRRVGQMSHA